MATLKTVKASHDGFRRAGIAFTKAGTTVDFDDLDKDQIAAIESDPRLTVTDDKGKKGKGKSE